LDAEVVEVSTSFWLDLKIDPDHSELGAAATREAGEFSKPDSQPPGKGMTIGRFIGECNISAVRKYQCEILIDFPLETCCYDALIGDS
jgi:hypothetical protein